MKKTLTQYFFIVLFLFVNIYSFSQEIITDPHFQRGFYVMDPDAAVFQGSIQFNTSLPPYWDIAQWDSKSSLINIAPLVLPSGFYKYANQHKDFRFGPIGSEDYDVYFAVNSDTEFNGVYRQLGEPWPALLVEQSIVGSPSLQQMSSLIYNADIQLLYSNIIIESGYNSSIHAAQFNTYFTVQNLNPSSSEYGKYLWLGITMYDDRDPTPGEAFFLDAGTQSMIYTIDYNVCAPQSLHNMNPVHFQVDILPYAKVALDTAWASGIMTASMDYNDYKIGATNIGWEMPGRNICTMVMKNISLIANTTPVTGINKTDEISVSIGPNPANNQISFKSYDKINSITMCDIMGKTISQWFPGSNDYITDIRSIEAGLYLFRIETESGRLVEKIVVQ